MTLIKKLTIVFFAVLLLLVGMTIAPFLTPRAHADIWQDHGPLVVGKIGGAQVYQMVVQGCEVFVVREYVSQVNHADSASDAIALGRGCH